MNINMLYLRKAMLSDVDILFEWVNDNAARQNAFNSHIITYEEHSAWFERLMNNPNQSQYIMMNGDLPIGQIRLTFSGYEAEIDYSISNSVRGHGYGRMIIGLIIRQVEQDYPFIEKLIGKVKTSNIVSYKCFVKNEFVETYKQLEYELKRGDT